MITAPVETPIAYTRLRERLAEVYDLARVATLLGWDELCMMPKGGAQTRADHKATLERIVHAKFVSDDIEAIIESLVPWADSLPYDSDEASYVRVARWNYYQFKKIPPELVVAMSRAASRSYHAWLAAKEQNDFALWREPLAEVTRLLIEVADALGYPERRYDAILQRREPGILTSHVLRVFERIRHELVPFARAVAESGVTIDDRVLHQPFDVDAQKRLGIEAIRAIGFDLERGRVDTAPHPISYSISPNDARLATRIKPDFFNACFFSCLHEAGHGIYFQGVPEKFRRTPLDGTTAQGANLSPVYGGISTGLHEGQSRLWENVLGRSRPFWEFVFPRVRAHFPRQTAGSTAEDWFRAVNRTQLTLIRTEADELTYDLHIMLRFDLENALFEEQLPVAELRDAWIEKSREYLGITPPDDRSGVLQDIHWSRGGHAGFPSYTLGNVISMQLWELMERDHPDLDERFRSGDLLVLREWMWQHLHRHGSKYQPLEVLKRLTGRAELDPGPYLRYLKHKFAGLYGLPADRA